MALFYSQYKYTYFNVQQYICKIVARRNLQVRGVFVNYELTDSC